MSDSDDDRRKEARLSPGDVDCEIEGANFVHVLGVTIEGHGMRVMTDQKLPEDRALRVGLHVSDSETLEFRGKVVWEKDENFEFTRRYISGIQFVDPDAAATNRLHRFIEDMLAREHPEGMGATDT